MKNYNSGRGSAAAGVLLAVAGAILLVAVLVGGYLGGWWLNNDVTNRQRHIDQNNYGSQLAYIQKIDAEIVEVKGIDASHDPSQQDERTAIVNEICPTVSLLTSVPDNIAAFASTECN